MRSKNMKRTVSKTLLVLALTTAVTLGGAMLGAFICMLWFAWVVRRSGLRLTFGQV